MFEIDSLSKVFTGTLLAQAVLDGEVRLDDPISMYLPEGVTAPEYEGRSITLLDRATYTSGLPRWPSNYSPRDPSNPFADYTMDQMYDFLSGYRLKSAHGSTYEYSCYGFALLGNLLVWQAGQADYDALLLERISRPLGKIRWDWAGKWLQSLRFTRIVGEEEVALLFWHGILNAGLAWWC